MCIYDFTSLFELLPFIALRGQDLDSTTDHPTHLIPDTVHDGATQACLEFQSSRWCGMLWYNEGILHCFIFHVAISDIRTWENLPWNSHEESKIMLHGFSFGWMFSGSLTHIKLARGNFLPHDTQTSKPGFPAAGGLGWRQRVHLPLCIYRSLRRFIFRFRRVVFLINANRIIAGEENKTSLTWREVVWMNSWILYIS